MGAGKLQTPSSSLPKRRSIYHLAALAVTMSVCTAVALSLFQQQRALPWQGTFPV